MKIVLLEFVDEAEALLKRYGKEFFLSNDTLIISLHPRIICFLKKMDIKSENTLSYLNNEAQHRISLFSEKLTRDILKDFSIVDEIGLSQGYQEKCAHHIRLYITHFLWIIEILKGIVQKHDVKAFFCCLPENIEAMYTQQGFITDRERFSGLLTQEFSSNRGIDFQVTQIKSQPESLYEKCLEKCLRFMAECVAKIDFSFFMNKSFSQEEIVVVPGLSYNMSKLLGEIKKKHPKTKGLMIWEGRATAKHHLYKIYLTLSNIWEKMRKQNLIEMVIHLDLIQNQFQKNPKTRQRVSAQFEALEKKLIDGFETRCVYEGVSWFEYLNKKIQLGLKEEICRLQHMAFVLSEIFKRIKPKLLMSMYSDGLYCVMGELAHKLSFETVNISHGTHVPPNNKIEEIENYWLALNVILNNYKHVAVQTPWTDRFLDYYQDKRSRLLTGPLLYSKVSFSQKEKIRGEILGEKINLRIVVHATTQKVRTGFRLHITETLDEYIATLSDIIQTVNLNEDLFFVLRPHPICDLTDEEFLVLLPFCARMKIVREMSFANVLTATDLLISYSSTCIEEALQSNIPVVLYDKWKRYNHFNVEESKDLKMLKRQPVYYVTQFDALSRILPKIVNSFEKRPLDDSELSDFKYPKEYQRNFINFVDHIILNN